MLQSTNVRRGEIYHYVKRGQLYLCDLGKPYGHEQGYIRPAIIIQNDVGNFYSPTTIVVPCTTKRKHNLPTHLTCYFSDENLIDFHTRLVHYTKNTVLTEQILTIDKKRLLKYLGTFTPQFMDKLNEKIKISLAL